MLGILIGLSSFVIIGIFHPIVIKAEYHFSKRIYPLFLIAGALFLFFSFQAENILLSSILGILGFSCLWSIRELFEQEKRVQRGWFPKKER